MYDDYIEDSKFDNIYDKKIYDWTINEIPMFLNEFEIQEIVKLYGNRATGKLFRGMSIDSLEELEELEKIMDSENREFDFGKRFVSSTPDKYEASSFMEFTKSYIPDIMADGMRKVIETGCKGDYAAVLMEFTIPNNKQVIFKNYYDKGEKELLLPTHTAETEVLLYGKVKVLNITIKYPLTMDNYKHNILKDIHRFNDLSYSPYNAWIKEHLKPDEKKELFMIALEQIKNNTPNENTFYRNLSIFLYGEHNMKSMFGLHKELFEKYPKIIDFISKKVQLIDDKPIIGIKINRENLYIEKEIDGFKISDIFSESLFPLIEKMIKDFSATERLVIRKNINIRGTEISIPILSNNSLMYKNKEGDDTNMKFYLFKKLLDLSSKSPELLNKLLKTDYYIENNRIIVDYINKNILEKEKEYSDGTIEGIDNFLENLEGLEPFLITDKKLVENALNYLKDYVDTGKMDSKSMDFLIKYTQKNTSNIFTNLVRNINYNERFESPLRKIKIIDENNSLEKNKKGLVK